MSRAELNEVLNKLYDVTEVSQMGAVPASVAQNTLVLLNPALQQEHSAHIVQECDSRGMQQLLRDDFVRAVSTALQATETSSAIRLVKEWTTRFRIGFRKQHLMYDAPANTPPPALRENTKAVGMFRDIFDCASRGSNTIERAQMKELVFAILKDLSSDATNVCKAALGDRDLDLVGFDEFMMVLQPATSKRPLTELLQRAKEWRAKEDDFHSTALPAWGGSRSSPSRAASSAAPGVRPGGSAPSMARSPSPTRGGAALSRLAPSSKTTGLMKELEQYKMADDEAEKRFTDAVGSSADSTVKAVVAAHARKVANAASANISTRGRESSLEREAAQLRLENEKLEHQLTAARLDMTGNPDTNTTKAAMELREHDQQTISELRSRVSLLEKELRVTKAQLGIASEGLDLMSLLKRAPTNQQALREFYADEHPLVHKHNHLREVAEVFHAEPSSAVATTMTQYDLLVCSYQALYRRAQEKYELTKQKAFDPFEAAASIVPKNPAVLSPRSARAGHVSPSASRAASPIKWRELDKEPTEEARGTGMLADPLLTNEERIKLRAKLAAKMRNSAKNYQAPRPRSSSEAKMRSASAASSVVSGATGSHLTMQRLSQIAGRASREHRLY